ncbi:MAG TPA: S8 family serine peptidase [Steroidobacteraceae bacterium]|nr:S8 family serine peptidase [Steroidobacteraceae bacterium]
MAQEKDERSAAAERSGTASRRGGEAAEDAARRTAAGATGRSGSREAGNGGNGGLATSPRARRRERYLIGIRALSGAPGAQGAQAFGAHPFGYPDPSMDGVVEYLSHQEQVEIVKRIKLSETQPFAVDEGTNEVVVARIDEGRAARLRASAPPYLIIERDSLLNHSDYLSVPGGISMLLPLRAIATEVTVRVLGERDQPLARATVVIEGGGASAQAVTDENGTARLTFFGGSSEAVQMLFVRAAANHWDRLLAAPPLSHGVNTVKLRPLSDLFPSFPGERLIGWGQRLMRLDPSARRLTGSGVRVGLIDSGCDTSHPLLRHITRGKDFTEGGDSGWTQDVLSHGTHCAGIINAASTGQGIVGCAPEAELHVFKLLPGGRTGDLLAALDECIQRDLDVISIGVASDTYSELVTQKLQEAQQKGIVCIAAAGNSGGAVGFPALVPGVIAVSAIGKLREFPADSSHARSIIPQLIGGDGIFAARFSCAGPQIAVSGPGVAVVSTVPGGGYAAADGTSAAAAHVTGLAALLLAHHPLLQEGPFQGRSAPRVQALFELIRASAVPHFFDPQRSGAGVPDMRRVPGGQELAMRLPASGSAEGATAPPPYGPTAEWPAYVQMRAAGLI